MPKLADTVGRIGQVEAETRRTSAPVVSLEPGHKQQLILFHFDGYDASRGLPIQGSWWAGSAEQAAFWLRNQGYSQVRLRPRDTTMDQVRVNDAALSLFFRQVAVMFGAGISLPQCLRLASFSDDRELSGAAQMLADLLASGYPLSRAMRSFPAIFDPVTCGLIAAAEKTGRLSAILLRIADKHEVRHKLRSSLISALTYPAILVLGTLIMAFLFFSYIFPIHQTVLASLKVQQSGSLLGLGKVMSLAGSPLVPALLLAAGGWYGLRSRSAEFRVATRRRAVAGLALLPGAADLIAKARALRELEVLSLLLDGGGNVDMALRLMLEGSERPDLLKEVRRRVIDGEGFAQAVREVELFPPLLTSLIEVGEESGQLSRMAGRAAEICEEDVRTAIETASTLIEPILLAFVGLLTGVTVLVSALPMLSVLRNL